MRDATDYPVATVQRLIAEASGRRLLELCAAYLNDPRPGVRSAVAAGQARHRAQLKESRRLAALYRTENELHARGLAIVAGIDEVGRGALAGPLTVGACILPPEPRIVGLNDSKRLSPARREDVANRIRDIALGYAVVHVPADQVDARGLTAALKSAMLEAVSMLEVSVDHILIDGNPLSLFAAETAIVGGDRKVAAIAAASVVAKVDRDALMRSHDAEFPQYEFAVNKGYGTRGHLEAIATHGMCPLHRVSFCPGRGTESLF